MFINPRRACAARVTVLGLSVCVCVFVCLSTFILELQATKRHVNDTLVFSATSARKIMWRIWLKRLCSGKRNRHRRRPCFATHSSISAVSMHIYYTLGRMLDWLSPCGAALQSPALLLQVPLAGFRTVVSSTRVCSSIRHGSCCHCCVSLLLAHAAPVAYIHKSCLHRGFAL